MLIILQGEYMILDSALTVGAERHPGRLYNNNI
jgi:hypothetical protein